MLAAAASQSSAGRSSSSWSRCVCAAPSSSSPAFRRRRCSRASSTAPSCARAAGSRRCAGRCRCSSPRPASGCRSAAAISTSARKASSTSGAIAATVVGDAAERRAGRGCWSRSPFWPGIAGGALWALWPGLLRLRSGTDEVITTLMGNFIAQLLLIYVTSGPLKDPSGSGQAGLERGRSPPPTASARPAGFRRPSSSLAVVVGLAMWLLVNRTAFGVLARLAGRNPVMVRWQGAKVWRLGLVELPDRRRAGRPCRHDRGLRPERAAGRRLPAGARLHRDPDRAGRRSLGRRHGASSRCSSAGSPRPALYLPVMAGLPAAAIDIINAAIALFITAKAGSLERPVGARRTGGPAMNDFIVADPALGTPLVYVTMAGVIAQRSGIWHLGLEGLMIIGACATVLGIALTGSLAAGARDRLALCVLASVLLWLVIEKLKANPIIAGLGLTGLGLGGTAFAVQAIFGARPRSPRPSACRGSGPDFGPYGVLSILVALMPVVVLGLWVLLRRTRFGLQLSACGEHPFAARSVGVDPPHAACRARARRRAVRARRRRTRRRQLADLRPEHDGRARLHGLRGGDLRRRRIRSAPPSPRCSSPSSMRSASRPSSPSAPMFRTTCFSRFPISPRCSASG